MKNAKDILVGQWFFSLPESRIDVITCAMGNVEPSEACMNIDKMTNHLSEVADLIEFGLFGIVGPVKPSRYNSTFGQATEGEVIGYVKGWAYCSKLRDDIGDPVVFAASSFAHALARAENGQDLTKHFCFPTDIHPGEETS